MLFLYKRLNFTYKKRTYMSNKDSIQLSKDILHQALTKGYFTLPNSEDIRELKPLEILALAKYVLKEGIVLTSDTSTPKYSLPSDILSSYEDQEEEL